MQSPARCAAAPDRRAMEPRAVSPRAAPAASGQRPAAGGLNAPLLLLSACKGLANPDSRSPPHTSSQAVPGAAGRNGAVSCPAVQHPAASSLPQAASRDRGQKLRAVPSCSKLWSLCRKDSGDDQQRNSQAHTHRPVRRPGMQRGTARHARSRSVMPAILCHVRNVAQAVSGRSQVPRSRLAPHPYSAFLPVV